MHRPTYQSVWVYAILHLSSRNPNSDSAGGGGALHCQLRPVWRPSPLVRCYTHTDLYISLRPLKANRNAVNIGLPYAEGAVYYTIHSSRPPPPPSHRHYEISDAWLVRIRYSSEAFHHQAFVSIMHAWVNKLSKWLYSSIHGWVISAWQKNNAQ